LEPQTASQTNPRFVPQHDVSAEYRQVAMSFLQIAWTRLTKLRGLALIFHLG
jgi:hypothetical protein